jgi:hypothetical protein
MMNRFKTEALRVFLDRLPLYGLIAERLPDKQDGTSSGYQCICKMTSRDHFTLYHSGRLDECNESGLELAFSEENIAQSLDKSNVTVCDWLNRVSNGLPIATSKTSHSYSRVGVVNDSHVSYLISQLDFLYGINQPTRNSYSLRPNRPKQAAFRAKLLSVYGSTCMITGSTDEEVLEACHIVPDSIDGEYHTGNGLLLRADLHKLFDEGLMSINPHTGEVCFSKSLTSRDYMEMAVDKIKISLPASEDDWPDKKRLAEHFNLYFSR